MGDESLDSEADLPAGDFSSWLAGMRAALRGEGESDVPCGVCTACCTSSQFVHIAPDETGTLSRIPAELLFPAPRLPRGHVLLGYDERGHCPMLIGGGCSIYEDRPRTCRTYDCRIFPAAGVAPDDDDDTKSLIARRTERWKFGFPGRGDRTERDAVRAAATFLGAQRRPEGVAPRNAIRLAVLAVEVHEAFLAHDDETGEAAVVDPDPEAVEALDTLAG